MSSRPKLPDVGAVDPELKTSPIAQEFDEDSDTLRQQVPGERVCYFNGRSYSHGVYVKSGTQVFKCQYGLWMEAGPGDPDNP
jgi:hypothetical protein